MSQPSVYYLPLQYTIYQKCLVDVLIQLHRSNIKAYLKRQEGEVDDEEMDDDAKTMSNESMFEAFIFNYKQITNHPSLLVDYYIPRDLLLLNTKENIVGLSNKYRQVSEILDRLVEKDARKTIVLSVSDAKEMDLVESFLLGKFGLQYYRFSGSSLYYDNHGSFDFHQSSKTNDQVSSEVRKAQNPQDIDEQKRRKPGRQKKSHGSAATSSSNENNNGNGSGPNDGQQRRKKSGRPSTAEKRAREQRAQMSAALANDGTVNGSVESDLSAGNNRRENKEEYIPKLSKNNREFCERLLEKKNKKLNVYLILSSQLKYLLQFEDLKSDLIISLDSKYTDFEEVSKILNYEIPILKPIVVESLEHYEYQMNETMNSIIFDDKKPLKRQQRLMNSKSNEDMRDSFDFRRLLVMLSLAAWSGISVYSAESDSPVSNSLIDWLIDPSNKEYPYPQTLETRIPLIYNQSLIDNVRDTLEAKYDLATNLGVKNLDNYVFFNEKLDNRAPEKTEHNDKKIKLNPEHCEVPERLSYSQYQFYLRELIKETLRQMDEWMEKSGDILHFVHLDETERQYIMDCGNADCGELFKKNRDLKVVVEAREKVLARMDQELEKVFQLNEMLKSRFQEYSELKSGEISDKKTKQNNEMEKLKLRLEELKMSISRAEAESNGVRSKYQETSTKAAESSMLLKKYESLGKLLQEESKGVFRKVQLKCVKDQQAYVTKKIETLTNDQRTWRGYLEILNREFEKRSNGVHQGNATRSGRNARTQTPY